MGQAFIVSLQCVEQFIGAPQLVNKETRDA